MNARDAAPEHEFEAEPGLPEPLPRGERLLWQGAPDWRVMAREAMHLRALAVYFGVLLAWRGANVLSNGGAALDAAQAVLWLLPLAALALAMLGALAWLVSRTALYTITDRRVVMRIGVVLTITFNLPYSKIDAARNAHILVIDEDIVSRPGPRLVLGVEAYARLVHPEIFGSSP